VVGLDALESEGIRMARCMHECNRTAQVHLYYYCALEQLLPTANIAPILFYTSINTKEFGDSREINRIKQQPGLMKERKYE
jgi:hypothetical protein